MGKTPLKNNDQSSQHENAVDRSPALNQYPDFFRYVIVGYFGIAEPKSSEEGE